MQGAKNLLTTFSRIASPEPTPTIPPIFILHQLGEAQMRHSPAQKTYCMSSGPLRILLQSTAILAQLGFFMLRVSSRAAN